MARKGSAKTPDGSGPGFEDHTDEAAFGDGTKFMTQEAPAPGSAGSTKSGRERKSTHWGGFGKTEADDPVRR